MTTIIPSIIHCVWYHICLICAPNDNGAFQLCSHLLPALLGPSQSRKYLTSQCFCYTSKYFSIASEPYVAECSSGSVFCLNPSKTNRKLTEPPPEPDRHSVFCVSDVSEFPHTHGHCLSDYLHVQCKKSAHPEPKYLFLKLKIFG